MTETISADEYNALAAKRKTNKYRNDPVEADGYRFASKAERRRYEELKLMIAAGTITDLEVHPVYPLEVKSWHGQNTRVGRYTADFTYYDADGKRVIEDVKGGRATRTEAYRLRKRLMEALHNITITEIEA